jgi:hypothetical protein
VVGQKRVKKDTDKLEKKVKKVEKKGSNKGRVDSKKKKSK